MFLYNKKKEEELSIKNWINGYKQIKFNLLFRMSRNGLPQLVFIQDVIIKAKLWF